MKREVSSKIVALSFGILVIVFLTIFYTIAWQEPTQAPPGGNVPAPLNVGPTPQTKIGGLILNWGGAPLGLYLKGGLEISGTSGYLKLSNLTTSQRNALSLEEGMMIYNTDLDEIEVYSKGSWKKISLSLVGKVLGESCTSPGECLSGYCVDGVCCDTSCSGSICQRCDSYSVNGKGHCGYVSSSSTDPDNECGTSECNTGNCKGDSYACGYYTSGERNCPACKTCQGATSTSCVTLANNTQDTEGSNLCNQTCKKCYGGSCVNQSNTEDVFGHCTTTAPGTPGSCQADFCNGSGACSYLSAGEQNQPGCKRCTGTSYDPVSLTDYVEDNEGTNLCNTICKGCSTGSCVNMPDNTQDTVGLNLCNATCKKCSGGSCINQVEGEDLFAQCGGFSCCGYCDGTGGCAYVAKNATCISPGTTCIAPYSCDESGSCKKALGESCSSPVQCASGYCADGVCCDSACSGSTCQRCDSHSVNGAGYCGYVKDSTVDPDNECGTSGCGTGNCKGDSYACGYYTSGKRNCETCKECNSVGSCVNVANNTDPYNECGGSSCCGYCSGGACVYVTEGSTCTSPGDACTTTHYRCNGGGNCTAPTIKTGCLYGYFYYAYGSKIPRNGDELCPVLGHDGCAGVWWSAPHLCDPNGTPPNPCWENLCPASACSGNNLVVCWNYKYDSPYLYFYNTSSYEFISDFGALGKENENIYFVEIPEEKIKEINGKYKLKIAGELDEITYLDKVYLKITDIKRADKIVYEIEPNENLPEIKNSDDNYLILKNGEELYLEFKAPKLKEGYQRKIEFAAEGYYEKVQNLNVNSQSLNSQPQSLAEFLGLESPLKKFLK